MLHAKKSLAILTLALLVASGFVASIMATQPEDVANLNPDQTGGETTTLQLGNQTVTMITEGDITTLMFEDGSMIIVNGDPTAPSVEIYESPSALQFTRIFVDHSIPVPIPVLPFDTFTDYPLPEIAPGVVVQDVDSSSGSDEVQTELVEMSLTSSDPIAIPTGFIHQERDFTGDRAPYTQFMHLANESDSEFRMYAGQDPADNPSDPQGVTLTGTRERTPDGSFGDTHLRLMDNTHPERLQADVLLHNNGSDFAVDSFFDIFVDLTLADGNNQQHSLRGDLEPDGTSAAHYLNATSGSVVSGTTGHEPSQPPLSERYPAAAIDDPALPFDVVDVSVSETSVGISFGYYEFMLYLDKFVLNYYAGDGTYIPIVIYFVTYEVVIIYEYITIIVYLEIIELITVIIIYEIIKIEVYITYIIMIIEVINIIIFEIIIYIIDITIIMIQINITINIFIIQIKIIINIINLIFILPIWIIIIPIPIFVPVFVPVFIPVPTPVPYVIAHTDVDLYDQTLNETADTIDLAYMVTNEYDQPITGATVDVTVDNGTHTTTFTATEDPSIPGLYNVTVPYDAEASYYVEAFPQYRPFGDLYYEQEDVPVVGRVITTTVPTTVSTTVTSNSTTTVTVAQNATVTTTAASPVPINPVFILLGLILPLVALRVRNKEEI